MSGQNLLTVPDLEAQMDELQAKIGEHRRLFEKFNIDSAQQWNELEDELRELRAELAKIAEAA